MRHKDTVVTKTDILQHVWDAHYDGPDNVVEVYVGYVRRKIDMPFGTNTIQTVRGVGYRLDSGDIRQRQLNRSGIESRRRESDFTSRPVQSAGCAP